MIYHFIVFHRATSAVAVNRVRKGRSSYLTCFFTFAIIANETRRRNQRFYTFLSQRNFMDSQTRKTKPKYEIIKEALLARIHAGDFSFDESFCTEKNAVGATPRQPDYRKACYRGSGTAGDSVPEARCRKLCFSKPFTGQQNNRCAENDFSSSSVRHHTGKYFRGNRKLKRCTG